MEGGSGMTTVTLAAFLLQLAINLLVSSIPTAVAIYFGMRLAIKHQFKAEKRRGTGRGSARDRKPDQL